TARGAVRGGIRVQHLCRPVRHRSSSWSSHQENVMRKISRSLFAAFATVATAPAAAQVEIGKPINLQEPPPEIVTVTATRTWQPIAMTGESVSVLLADDL